MRLMVLSLPLFAAVMTLPCAAQTKLPKVAQPGIAVEASDSEPCDAGPDLPDVQCMAEQLKLQGRKPNKAYRAAL